MNTEHHMARMDRPVQVPASNSTARKRMQPPQPHHDPAVVELMARAWDEGYGIGVYDGVKRHITDNPYRDAS